MRETIDFDSFNQFITRKKHQLLPEKCLTLVNEDMETLTSRILNASAENNHGQIRVPLFYRYMEHNVLNESNFKLFNLWFLRNKNNFDKLHKLSLKDRAIELKK